MKEKLMSRKIQDMSAEDKQIYKTYQDRLGSHASTAVEKVDARKKMDELEWKGQAGGVFGVIDALTTRIEKVENMKGGGGKSAVSKKAFDSLEGRVNEAAVDCKSQGEVIGDLQSATSALVGEGQETRRDLGKASALVRELQKTIGNVQKRQGEDSKTVAKMMTAIEARLAKLEQFQADAVADMIDEAKTAIHAEAVAAAKAAVAELMGDG